MDERTPHMLGETENSPENSPAPIRESVALVPVHRSRPLAEIRADIRQARVSTIESISELRQEVVVRAAAIRREVATRIDWHTYVNARPWLFVGAAFCFGFLLATASSRRR